MQFSKILLLMLVLALASCTVKVEEPLLANEAVDKRELKLNPEEGLVYYKNRPFSGISQSFSPAGVKVEAIQYLKGKKHALHQKWFGSGQLSYQASHSFGKLDGLVRTWWKDGQLRSESNFVNGMAHGVQKQWYQSGSLFKERNLVKGKEEGFQRAWRENGKIYNNYEAKNGRIFGLKRANLCYELDNEVIQYKKQ